MGRILHTACWLGLCACGENDKEPACGADCTVDAGASSAHAMDAGRRPVPPSAPFMPDAGAGAALQARVQVNGATVTCGSCAVLLAQVQGGKPPYTYAWSDPTLIGPGPHQVCPSAPTTYSVVVSDDSAEMGEIAREAAQVQTSGSVNCTADAGIDGPHGCFVPAPAKDGGVADADASVGVICGDAGVSAGLFGVTGTVVGSVKLSDLFSNLDVFRAGKTYSYRADRLLPFNLSLGDPVKLEILGANSLCEPAEKLISLTFDVFSWHQQSCFTPKQDYRYVIETVTFDGELLYWDFLQSATICDTCESSP
jgi:hypothetical protein